MPGQAEHRSALGFVFSDVTRPVGRNCGGAPGSPIGAAPGAAAGRVPTVLSVAPALPAHYRDQETLIEAAKRHWIRRRRSARRLERAVSQHGRRGAPPRALGRRDGRAARVRRRERRLHPCAVELGARAIVEALARAISRARDVDHVFFASVTGIAAPSLDARLVNRLGLRSDVKRTPIFGLGCVAGAAGIARAADYLRAYPAPQRARARGRAVQPHAPARRRLDREPDRERAVRRRRRRAWCCGGAELAGARAARARDALGLLSRHRARDGLGGRRRRVPRRAVGRRPARVRGRAAAPTSTSSSPSTASRSATSTCSCVTRADRRCSRRSRRRSSLPPDALARSWRHLSRGGQPLERLGAVRARPMRSASGPRAGTLGLLLAMGPGFCSELVLLGW